MRSVVVLSALLAMGSPEESCDPKAWLDEQLAQHGEDFARVKGQAEKLTEDLEQMPEDFERIRKKVEEAKEHLETREIRTREELERQGVFVPPPEGDQAR